MEDKTSAEAHYLSLRAVLDLLNEERPQEAASQLRQSLQFITAALLTDSGVRFPDLFSRLEFLGRKYPMKLHERMHLQKLRINTKRTSNHQFDAEEVRDALRSAISLVYQACQSEIPEDLRIGEASLLKAEQWRKPTIAALRAVVVQKTPSLIQILPEHEALSEAMNLRRESHPPTRGGEHNFDLIEEGDSLSLLDLRPDGDFENHWVATHIVYQPDYLIDVSGLAECFQILSRKEISNAALWFLNKFSARDSSIPLFLGNLVNDFLDDLVQHGSEAPLFKTLFGSSFGRFPLEYLQLFPEDRALIDFMKGKALPHYNNLLRVTQNDFIRLTPPLALPGPLVEPSFMSPELGLQGRLDLLDLHREEATIIELKSGKLPWPDTDPDAINENHAAQGRLYKMLVNRVLGLPFNKIHVYLLYSSGIKEGSNLRYVARYVNMEKRLLEVRNQIVAFERRMAQAASASEVFRLLQSWNFEGCGFDENDRVPAFFKAKFDLFQDKLQQFSDLERAYLCAFTGFISREQWLSRMGDGTFRRGHSALWNKGDEEVGDLTGRMGPLTIMSNNIHQQPPRMQLHLEGNDAGNFDFRRGDICVLFPIDDAGNTAVNQQVIKAYIADEPGDDGIITLGFRNAQQHREFFDSYAVWAIEHDYMDQGFQVMQRDLFNFLASKNRMKSVILGEIEPGEVTQKEDLPLINADMLRPESITQLKTLLSKALNAPDFFLLVGPPGTGKTSLFLSNLIALSQTRGEQILLLAYTNRAVDEICAAVELALGSDTPFLRIGSSTSCDPRYTKHLLHRLADASSTRKELQQLIDARRVVVSTVSSIANRTDIFALKHFDRIVVDEASQVLEPVLVNVLRYAPRFVLIGDDRQLPAVVQQSSRCNILIDDVLKNVGLTDLRASLFERLLKRLSDLHRTDCWGTLTFQGRMHPEISAFVSKRWYGDSLHPAGRQHQTAPSSLPGITTPLDARMVFIESGKREAGDHQKTHRQEARIVAAAVAAITESLDENVNPAESIGIIAPYRSQIARIKSALRAYGIPKSEDITVDTVERFQGSQRDHILYSTTVSERAQMKFLSMNSKVNPLSGTAVDRKLNVAITRARKQFVLIGHGPVLEEDSEYAALMAYIRREGKASTAHAFLTAFGSEMKVPF